MKREENKRKIKVILKVLFISVLIFLSALSFILYKNIFNESLNQVKYLEMSFLSLFSGLSILDIFFDIYGCTPNDLRCNGNKVELCIEGKTWREIERCGNKCRYDKCI